MASDGPKCGQEDVFPTNPDLADILGRTDLDFENVDFLFFGPQISGFPDPQTSNFPDFQIPRSPNSQISRFPDFQTPSPAPPPDDFSDPNLTPLPTHPGIKYVARALAAILLRVRDDAASIYLSSSILFASNAHTLSMIST